jgi:hypothetical protein
MALTEKVAHSKILFGDPRLATSVICKPAVICDYFELPQAASQNVPLQEYDAPKYIPPIVRLCFAIFGPE